MSHLLSHYHSIVQHTRSPKYLQCKYHPVVFSSSDSTQHLWNLHNKQIQQLKPQQTRPKQSLIDLKKELADRIFQDCQFCEHRCHINRHHTTGYCNVSISAIPSAFVHQGEEPPLIPSFTIFFSGCTFKCVFCQNHDISQTITGHHLSSAQLGTLISQQETQNIKNINWVGGDPTPNIPFILSVLQELADPLPQIWNSNMYCSQETMSLLNGIIDLYLTDFKFGNDSCAKKLAHVDNYTKIIKRNHLFAAKQADVLIRHLVLPSHSQCCSIPIIDWISHNLPTSIVNIMDQYYPHYHAHQFPPIAQTLSPAEYHTVLTYAQKNDLHLI